MRGIVVSGKGEGKHFTQLDWVRQQFRDKLGFEPHAGTLNLRVQDAGALRQALTHAHVRIEPPDASFCAARCARILLNGSARAVWIVPEVDGYPAHQVEVMAEVSLRDALGLRDGDPVEIEFEGAG